MLILALSPVSSGHGSVHKVDFCCRFLKCFLGLLLYVFCILCMYIYFCIKVAVRAGLNVVCLVL